MYIYPGNYHFWCSSFPYIPIFIWHHFSSARRSAFKISCRVSMLMINSLAFVCLRKFLFTSIFEGLLTQIEFQVNRIFSFSNLKIMPHCLLTCIVSNRKSDVILIFVPLFLTSLSFLAAFMISSLSLGLNNLIMKCHCVFFSCTQDSYSFLNLENFHPLFIQLFLLHPFFSFRDSNYMCNRLHSIVPQFTNFSVHVF